MLKLGILVSGQGSNLQAIIDNIEKGILDAEIKVVISDKKNAYALTRAKKHGIFSCFINPESFKTKKEFEDKIVKILKEKNIELIILAGFMKILSPYFIKQYKNRIMNIHPSLLPAFKGLSAQKQALEYGVKIAGCTVHFVDEGTDTGPIILQRCVNVNDNDTLITLSERILKEEHKVYSEAIKLYSKNKLKIIGNKIKIVN